MGLTLQALHSLKPYLKGKILCLGYQDIVATQGQVKNLFGVEVEKTTTFGGWHGANFPLPETEEFFQKVGCDHFCLDIAKIRGPEIVADLNKRLYWPKEQFDLVIDGGTIEHCFNCAQAFINAAELVKVGGHIFHWNPISMVNHGFYNFSPTLYHDFYTQNGWEIEEMMVVSGKGFCSEVPATKRIQVASELSNMVIARRLSSDEFKFPMQTKYLKNPGLK